MENGKNANYEWLLLMYAKLAPRGKAAILMPNGATTSNTTDDYKLQKKMLKESKVEAILALHNKLFSNVSISMQCWILNRGKTDKRVLFINADESDKISEEEIKEDVKKTSAELFELINEERELEEKIKKILQSEIE